MSDTRLNVAQVTGGLDGSASGYFKLGNMMIQWGWTFVTGNGTSPYGAVTGITYPVAFKTGSFPHVVVTMLNSKNGSDPANIGEFVTVFTECVVSTINVTATTFTGRWYKTTGNLDNGYRIGMSWIAVGLIA